MNMANKVPHGTPPRTPVQRSKQLERRLLVERRNSLVLGALSLLLMGGLFGLLIYRGLAGGG